MPRFILSCVHTNPAGSLSSLISSPPLLSISLLPKHALRELCQMDTIKHGGSGSPHHLIVPSPIEAFRTNSPVRDFALASTYRRCFVRLSATGSKRAHHLQHGTHANGQYAITVSFMLPPLRLNSSSNRYQELLLNHITGVHTK